MNRFALLALPALALIASCGQKDANSSAPAAPVTGVKPPPGTDWVSTVAQTDDGGFRMGNPSAPIKLVEYGSRTCPHCAKFSADSGDALKAYVATGKVSYEFRDFPIHAPDIAAILLGRCGGPGPFFTILEQMFASQADMMKKLEGLPPETQGKLAGMNVPQQAAFWADTIGYRDFVEQRGVSADQAKTCLADQKTLDQLDAMLKAADEKYHISGTPTFILNGDVVNNVGEWDGVKTALKAAGA